MPLPIRTRGAPARGKPKADKRHRQDKPLTAAQELFVARYMTRFNATQAYQDTHPTASYATARVEGSRLRRDPRVARLIEELVADGKRRLQTSADRALDELAAIAFSNVAELFGPNGAMIPPHELPWQVAVALKEVKRHEIKGATPDRPQVIGQTVEIKMHDKIAALKLLGQYYGVF